MAPPVSIRYLMNGLARRPTDHGAEHRQRRRLGLAIIVPLLMIPIGAVGIAGVLILQKHPDAALPALIIMIVTLAVGIDYGRRPLIAALQRTVTSVGKTRVSGSGKDTRK